jgi:hypothetical protein
VFAPDGGAHSIATIDTSVADGRNIVAVFGQWGAIQLILAGLLWVLLLRYPGLAPLILCALLSEPILRALSSRLKPLETVGVAPGHRYDWLALLPVGLTLYLALCPSRVRGSRVRPLWSNARRIVDFSNRRGPVPWPI